MEILVLVKRVRESRSLCTYPRSPRSRCSASCSPRRLDLLCHFPRLAFEHLNEAVKGGVLIVAGLLEPAGRFGWIRLWMGRGLLQESRPARLRSVAWRALERVAECVHSRETSGDPCVQAAPS